MKSAQLYIISEGPEGPVKIGRSTSARIRLGTLQTGNARPLSVAAVYTMPIDQVIEAEQYLHEELGHWALVGEWFELSEQFMAEYMPDFILANGYEATLA